MGQKYYQRFNLFERWQHGILFTTVTLLILTGFPLRYYDIPFWRWVYSLFGGLEVARVLHRIFGIILIADFFANVYYITRKVLVARAKKAMKWEFDPAFTILPTLKDVVDLYHNLLYLFWLRKEPPRFAKFSYMEKFDYWAVWWGMVIMGVTGVCMFLPTVVTYILPGQIIPISMIAHSDEVILIVLVIFIWHFYHVHFRPRYFPISLSFWHGKLTQEEMKEEHGAEYDAILKREAQGGNSDG